MFLRKIFNTIILFYYYYYCYSSLEFDIDGKTLEMMNNVERISTIIPKFKQQLLFLEEREKLFKKLNDCLIQGSNLSSVISMNSPSLSIAPTYSQSSSLSLALELQPTTDSVPKPSIDNSSPEQSVVQININVSFPDDYVIPTLPNGILNDIEKGDLQKFGPHCSNRQILIDTITYDLIDKFKLFYPTHKQFDNIGTSIVKFLGLPFNKQNVTIWKDALQTKLKRKRSEHRHNLIVQDYQMKYSRTGSGRPVKRQIGETAQRDRFKQMVVLSFDDGSSNESQTKLKQLRDTADIDFNIQLQLWKETLPYRRKMIRDRSTTDILKDFPEYSNPMLVFEEVKILMKIDLSAAIRRQVPLLLNKIVETPIFVTDSLPVQLIKTLCRQFDETIQHTFSDTEPFTPYPTLVCANDRIHVYVDFHLVVSTTSPDDALALLIGMYTIFELTFSKKSRTARFLYSILHGDKRFLSNSIRIFNKEKSIDLYSEQNQSSITSASSASNSSTTIIIESQPQVQNVTQCDLSEENDSMDIVDSSLKIHNSTNECNDLAENEPKLTQPSSSSSFNSKQQTTQQRKRTKRSRNMDIYNDTCSIDIEQSQCETQSQTQLPLNDLTNSSSNVRQNKRRRRI